MLNKHQAAMQNQKLLFFTLVIPLCYILNNRNKLPAKQLVY
jgi:hypothetical protein